MYGSSGLLPARFLILMAHLITSITLLWARDENVKACLPLQFTEAQYQYKDTQLIVGLSVSLVLVLLELCSLFAGVSLFSHLTSLISIVCHSSACVSLFYFALDEWECDLFWWIFGLCCLPPALTETLAILRLLLFKKGL